MTPFTNEAPGVYLLIELYTMQRSNLNSLARRECTQYFGAYDIYTKGTYECICDRMCSTTTTAQLESLQGFKDTTDRPRQGLEVSLPQCDRRR